MEEKNKNWNLKKLERQAMENQNFDNFVLNQSKILEYENLKVLDVGCSNGCKTEMLFGKYENIDNITGIDVDENAINEAKSKFVNNKKYSFELKNIEDLNSENKYDIICLSYVLQHLENPKKVLNILKGYKHHPPLGHITILKKDITSKYDFYCIREMHLTKKILSTNKKIFIWGLIKNPNDKYYTIVDE